MRKGTSQKVEQTKRDKKKGTMVTGPLDFLRSALLLALAGLIGEEFWVDEGNDTTLADDDVAEKFVQPTIRDE